MKRSPPDSPPPRPPRAGRSGVAWFTLWLSLAASTTALARNAPPIANPHGAFKEECGLCHSSESWKTVRVGRRFDHSKYGFRLEGAHAGIGCRSCHGSLDFSQPKTQCASCHEDPHRGEMGTDCARCHTARSFIDRAGMMRAHQLTRFALTGSHAGLECEQCHRPAAQGRMQFVGTRGECQECHLDAYRATTAPGHEAAGFPLECATCHTPILWNSARFDHALTRFPLTGAHRAAACASCHGDGVYRGKATDCYSCHRANYEATATPAHVAAGFSTACASCHNTATWAGATFEHDPRFFPIYSGVHAGKWSDCTTCHASPASYAVFTCFSCHPHSDKPQTDSNHSGVSGYRYDSQSCYNCHPRGRH